MSFCKATSIALMGTVLAAQASAQSAGSFEFYGHLNLGFLSIDDGVDSNTYFTDNDNSNSRVGLIYTFPPMGESQLKFQFETGLGLRGSSAVTPDMDDLVFHYTRSELRKLELIYARPGLGTFSFGQGSTATDGIGETDFSGTSVVQYSGIADIGGATAFRLSDGRVSGTTMSDAFKSLDGGRRFRVRYDTPSYGGFSFAASYGQELLNQDDDRDFTDISTKYASENETYKLSAALGYAWADPGSENFVGSAAILHKPTGLNASFAGAGLKDGGEYLYFKAGIIRDWFSVGSTALSVDYYMGSDFAFTGAEEDAIGLAVVQRVDRYNLELYGSYRTHELTSDTAEFQDIDLVMIGARWKF